MRIYCPPEAVDKDRIIITDREQIHHLADVYRLKVGDTLLVFDGQAKEYDCLIAKKAKERVELLICRVKSVLLKGPSITLACAIPKKAKIEYIIEKATELGVDTIIPLQTERTIVRISPESADNKLTHWQAIAREASKQCGRVKVPVVEEVAKFKEIIKRIKDYDLGLMPFLGAENKPIKEVCSNFKAKSVIVFIGPEGDFSQSEVNLAQEKGCLGVSLGEFVLKVDTAAIAVVSFLRFLLA